MFSLPLILREVARTKFLVSAPDTRFAVGQDDNLTSAEE
jgi:hypothetical protein